MQSYKNEELSFSEFIFGFFMVYCLFVSIFSTAIMFSYSVEETKCEQENNVYDCEYIGEYKPVKESNQDVVK